MAEIELYQFIDGFIVLQMWVHAFWVTIVIIFCRSDTAATSFFTAIQRIEGTVLGAIYAFVMFHFLDCTNGGENEVCSWGSTTVALVLWIGFCSLFRDSKSHFYAAQVAGMTPILMFLSKSFGRRPTSISVAYAAWQCVMMQTMGLALYLTIDNVICPVTIGSAITGGVAASLSKTALVAEKLTAGVGVVVEGVKADTSEQPLGDSPSSNGNSRSDIDNINETDDNDNNNGHCKNCDNMSAVYAALQIQEDVEADINRLVTEYSAVAQEALTEAATVITTIRRLQDAVKIAGFEPDIWNR
jgi:hypothetical protein